MSVSRRDAVLSVTAGTLAAALAQSSEANAQAGGQETVVQLWSRADRSGPLRAGNIQAAAELLNKQLQACGATQRVRVNVHENNQDGYDADALDLMRAFAVNRGPDAYVTSHTWLGEFATAGHAMNLEQHIQRYPEQYADMIPVFWNATKFRGARHAIPQDSEIRMLKYNKDMLRRIGKDNAFIEGLPGQVERGEFTATDLANLAKEVVDRGAARIGMIHRPNAGPDYIMIFAAFGISFMDEQSGKLVLPRAKMREALTWWELCARTGVFARNNTTMSWDAIKTAWKQEEAFIYHHGVWEVGWQTDDSFGRSWPGANTREGYFRKVGWMHMPPAQRGGKPANLTHPIVYVINPRSPRAELAATLVAMATTPHFNNKHAVTTNHTAILSTQASAPEYVNAWPLAAATSMLQHTSFQPNHSKFGRYNGVLFRTWQGIETGRLNVDRAMQFLESELQNEVGSDLSVVA
jgi:inositol-phosphate transport system substrate-binding protein